MPVHIRGNSAGCGTKEIRSAAFVHTPAQDRLRAGRAADPASCAAGHVGRGLKRWTMRYLAVLVTKQ